jgi:co-chaperonin GroES (HSP10)
MKLFWDIIIVEPDVDEKGMLADDSGDTKRVNRGRIKAISENITTLKLGDIVHFSDMSGIHMDKTNKSDIILSEKDILFVSDYSGIFVLEELSFYGDVEVEKKVIL